MPYHDEPVEILPRLFLGSERNASHRRVLDRLRIRHIVNVGQECENYFIIGGGGGTGEAGGERTVDLGALAKRRVSASGDLVRGATATATISLDVEEMGGDEEPPLSPIYNPLNMAGAESDPHAASGQWLSSTTAYAAAGADPPQTPLHAEAHSRAPFTPIRTSMPQLPGPKTPVSQPSLAIATRPSRLARSVTAEAAEDTSPAVEAAATGAIPTTVSPDTDVAAMALTLERTRLGTSGEAGGNAVPSHATSSQPFHYLHLPWTHNQENIQSYFAEAFAFMDEGRGNVDDAPVRRSGHTTEDTTLHGVLVHCKQGVSRSASLVIAYVMHARRMSFNDAYALVKSKSPSITPNMSLIYQLLEFEKKVLGRAEEKTGSV